MRKDEGVVVEARVPVEAGRLLETVSRIEEALPLCEMVGRVQRLPNGELRVVFLPRHMGLRIPHSYVFQRISLPNGVVLEGRAFLRRLTIRVEVGDASKGSIIRVSAQCRGPELLRRIARKEVHRFLGQLLDSLFITAVGRNTGNRGSERSPSLILR